MMKSVSNKNRAEYNILNIYEINAFKFLAVCAAKRFIQISHSIKLLSIILCETRKKNATRDADHLK